LGTVPNAFWWQWPCTRIGRPPAAARREAAGARFADDELLEQHRLGADRRRGVAEAHDLHLVAQRQQARRLEADDGDAALGERQEGGEQRRARAFAASAMPAASSVRPQQSSPPPVRRATCTA
jgi:hypothetical protein